jgi:hypothetical protein
MSRKKVNRYPKACPFQLTFYLKLDLTNQMMRYFKDSIYIYVYFVTIKCQIFKSKFYFIL